MIIMIIYEEKFKAMAIVHSEESKGTQEIELKQIVNGKNHKVTYEAVTPNGIKCTAIFNPFTRLYYVDDIYGKIES